MPHLASVLLLLILPASVVAQCAKPKVPATGLPVQASVDNAVTYADGYRTRLNFYWPRTTVPSCGWPLVVHVHGYGGRRSNQTALAARGFAVATYDVRGQGDAKALNPPTMGMTWYGPVERYDLAEIVAFVRSKWKSALSPDKLAVTGGSQGGIHSWFAAAESGRSITVPGRGTITFPKLAVSAPQNFIPDVMDHAFRGDTLITLDAFERIFSSTAAVIDPALRSLAQAGFLSQDIAGLARTIRGQPGRAIHPLLAGTRVPILYSMAWFDEIQHPREAMGALASIPAATPLQAVLSTIGHGSPANAYESRLRDEQRVRWFDRYLWGIKNGVEDEARFVHGVVPARVSDFRNAAFLWDHRHDAGWPASDLAAGRLYLTAGGALQPSPPSASAPTLIQHRVRAGYTPSAFLSNRANRSVATILANVPLSERVFRAATLTEERELGGAPRVSLPVVPSAERFTLCALLVARVPGQEIFMLSSWGRGVVGAKVGVPLRLEFDLAPAMAVLPKGTVLELVLRNHWLREDPMQRRIVTAPYFADADVLVRHGSGTDASWIDLPWRRRVRAGLVAATNVMVAARPANLAFRVRGGAARANRVYVQLATMSGHAPGIPLPGGVLPLQPDALTGLFLQVLPLWPPRFLGTLDGAGQAAPLLDLTGIALPPSFAGQRMSFATWILDGTTSLQGSPTNPVDLIFR